MTTSDPYDRDAYDKAIAAWQKAVKKTPNLPPPDLNRFVRPGQTAPALVSQNTGYYDPKFGGKPGVPNPNATAGESIVGNLANFDDLTKLTTKTNDLLGGEYVSRLPGYTDLANQNSLNIGAQLRGEVPQDVVNLLGQQAAERGVGGGVSGSQFSNSDYLRSLGLTSIGQQKEGAANYDRSLGRIKDIPTFDPTSMFTHPEDLYNAHLQKNIFDAAPEPYVAGRANEYLALQPGLDQAARERAAAAKKAREDMDTLLQASRVNVANPTGR